MSARGACARCGAFFDAPDPRSLPLSVDLHAGLLSGLNLALALRSLGELAP